MGPLMTIEWPILWNIILGILLASAAWGDPLEGDVSIKTVTQMTFFAKLSAIAYCPFDSINRFDCKLCRDDQLAGTHSITTFNDSATGVQGCV